MDDTPATTESDQHALAEYRALKAREEAETDPRVLEAYRLQEQVAEAKERYEELKDKLHELLTSVGPYKNEFFAVSNLKRAPRKINMDLLRRNFPDLVEKAEPSEKYIITALIEEFGKPTLLNMARDHNPDEYDRNRTMSISDFDKLTGDSSKKFLYAGIAYEERWIEDKKEDLCITRLTTAIKSAPKLDPLAFCGISTAELEQGAEQ